MTTRDVHDRRQEGVGDVQAGRREAAVVGTLLGGVVSGVALMQVAPVYLVLVGSLVGVGSTNGALAVWLVLSALLGAGFAAGARAWVDPDDPVADSLELGAGYGAVAAAFGVTVVPAVVGVATQFAPDVPLTSGGVVGAYLLLGLGTGAGYAASLEDMLPSLDFLDAESRAVVVGSLVAGFASGVLLWAASRIALARLSASLGLGALPEAGFLVWLVLSLAFGAVFSRVVADKVDREEGMRLALAKAGVMYGGVLAVVAGMIAVPTLTGSLSAFSPSVPLLAPGVLVAYVVYGTVLGVAYGAVLGGGRVLPAELGRGRGPVAVGAVTGAVVGGVFLAGAVGIRYFAYMAISLRLGPSVSMAWTVWLIVAVLLAYGFERTIAPDRDSEDLIEQSVKRGTLYGAVAGGALVALVPAMVSATDYAFALSAENPIIFLGYVVYGAAVGFGYGASIEGLEVPALGSERQRAVVFGSLFGGFTGGLVLHHLAGRVWIQFVGSLVQVPGSIAVSWLAWLGLCLALGLIFQWYLDANIDAYVNSLMTVTANNESVRSYTKPFVQNAALTSTAGGMGALYGLVAGVVVGLLVLPLAVVTVTTFVVPVPATEPSVVAGFVVYGLFLGVGYGTILEF